MKKIVEEEMRATRGTNLIQLDFGDKIDNLGLHSDLRSKKSAPCAEILSVHVSEALYGAAA
jgi:hypothetical protein